MMLDVVVSKNPQTNFTLSGNSNSVDQTFCNSVCSSLQVLVDGHEVYTNSVKRNYF